jgi:hypothetical protein
VSTLADWVGVCTASLAPLIHLIRRHLLAGERLHGDDTTAPVLAKDKTVICRTPRGGPAARCGPFATWTEEREGHDLEVVARPPRILPARCLGRRPNPRFQPRSTDRYHWGEGDGVSGSTRARLCHIAGLQLPQLQDTLQRLAFRCRHARQFGQSHF